MIGYTVGTILPRAHKLATAVTHAAAKIEAATNTKTSVELATTDQHSWTAEINPGTSTQRTVTGSGGQRAMRIGAATAMEKQPVALETSCEVVSRRESERRQTRSITGGSGTRRSRHACAARDGQQRVVVTVEREARKARRGHQRKAASSARSVSRAHSALDGRTGGLWKSRRGTPRRAPVENRRKSHAE